MSSVQGQKFDADVIEEAQSPVNVDSPDGPDSDDVPGTPHPGPGGA